MVTILLYEYPNHMCEEAPGLAHVARRDRGGLLHEARGSQVSDLLSRTFCDALLPRRLVVPTE
jgi:hypothetical protein